MIEIKKLQKHTVHTHVKVEHHNTDQKKKRNHLLKITCLSSIYCFKNSWIAYEGTVSPLKRKPFLK